MSDRPGADDQAGPAEHWAAAFDATETIEEAVGQAIGAASMCWENPGGAGVFDSSRAGLLSKLLYEHVQLRWSLADSRPVSAPPSEGAAADELSREGQDMRLDGPISALAVLRELVAIDGDGPADARHWRDDWTTAIGHAREVVEREDQAPSPATTEAESRGARRSGHPCPTFGGGCYDPEHCMQGGRCEDAKRFFAVPAAPPVPAEARRLSRIAEAHSKNVDSAGGSCGDCVECGWNWPCATYVWATEDRDGLAPWNPADDEEEGPDA